MTTPARHPVSGQFVTATGLPTGDLVNQELQSKPNAPPDEAAAAVPSGLPDHDAALAAAVEVQPGPDATI